MRYLPLDAADRAAMLARVGVPDVDALFADIPADKRIDGLLDLPLAASEMEVERILSAMAGAQPRGRVRAVLSRRGRLQAPHSGDRRPPDPALGIPDQLHALPARDRPGHAEGPVRVPDPGRDADRHGGRQRLDVRRLDRLRRGDADGAPADEAREGGAVGRPASAIRRRRGDARASGRRYDRAPAARRPRRRGHRCRDRRRDELRHRPEPGLLRQSARPRADRRGRARARRPRDRGLHRAGLARRPAFAGRDGRRHRRRRGPVDRQRADVRRPLRRTVRDAAEVRAPDAGPPRRRDGGRRRPAQLRADAVDPRAAHPAREGDEQHLHQLGPVRARLLDPPRAARRSGPEAAGATSTTPTRSSWPTVSPPSRASRS